MGMVRHRWLGRGVCLLAVLWTCGLAAGPVRTVEAGEPAKSGSTGSSSNTSRPLTDSLGESNWRTPPESGVNSLQGTDKSVQSRKDPYIPSYYNTQPVLSNQLQSDGPNKR